MASGTIAGGKTSLVAAVQAHRAGRLADAERLYRLALAANPSDADAAHLLGALLGRSPATANEAVELLRRAVTLDPAQPTFRLNLGNCLARLRRWPEAEAQFREALRLKSDYAAAWRSLGRLLGQTGRWLESADAYANVTCRNRKDADAWMRQAQACRRAQRPAASLYPLREAIKWLSAEAAAVPAPAPAPAASDVSADPSDDSATPDESDDTDTQETGTQEPDQAWTPPVNARPLAAASHSLASSLGDLGRSGEAAEAFTQAARFDPAHPHVASDALHLLHYDGRRNGEELRAAAETWAANHANPLTPNAAETDKLFAGRSRDPERRIRVGLLSGDFREHPVGRFSPAIVAYLDRQAFDLICYDDARKGDRMTERLRSFPGVRWEQTHGQPDAALVERIRRDEVDLLVDLSGHMGQHRLQVFARRAAPVQMTHFNYPATSGMAAMDWRMSDDLAEPPGAGDDRFSVERLYRLGPCAWCYDPGLDSPEVGPPPVQTNGYVTFCSLNKPLKHSAQTIALWSEILQALPTSKLLLLGWGDEREDVMLHEPFAAHGIGRDRLIFAPRGARRYYLSQYSRADVALDPFPYNGGITSCDAMHMGLPMITLAGDSYRVRQGQMLLSNVGLPELIAADATEYVSKAVALANDLPRMADLRAGMRERFARSVVCDQPAFARRLGDAYRAMWREWCGRLDSATVSS